MTKQPTLTSDLSREEKIAIIRDTICKDCSIIAIMNYCREQGWNMVLTNNGKIMFNKAGTKDAKGSYKAGYWDLDRMRIDEQSDDTVDFIYSLI